MFVLFVYYIVHYITRKTDSIQHHHPEGVVYRSFCLNSGTVAVSEAISRRWWCIESVFPITLHYILLHYIVAIFYPFSQFCEIDSSLPSLQTQPKTAPNLFQRGVEDGNYDITFYRIML